MSLLRKGGNNTSSYLHRRAGEVVQTHVFDAELYPGAWGMVEHSSRNCTSSKIVIEEKSGQDYLS